MRADRRLDLAPDADRRQVPPGEADDRCRWQPGRGVAPQPLRWVELARRPVAGPLAMARRARGDRTGDRAEPGGGSGVPLTVRDWTRVSVCVLHAASDAPVDSAGRSCGSRSTDTHNVKAAASGNAMPAAAQPTRRIATSWPITVFAGDSQCLRCLQCP